MLCRGCIELSREEQGSRESGHVKDVGVKEERVVVRAKGPSVYGQRFVYI